MAITAHPDDETLGLGGTLARYGAEGVETHVLSATQGESGRHGEGPPPGPEALGRLREGELRRAAAVLGVTDVQFLGYPDGALDQADPGEAIARIVDHLRRVRPQVVLTFGPDGAYGHPDHIAICQFATAAVLCAADGEFAQIEGACRPPHRVSKLYYMAWPAETWEIYQETFKTLTSTVDGVVRQAVPWSDWSLTTRIDARPWWRQVWRAVQEHRTQMSVYGPLAELSEDRHEALWGNQSFYRVLSTVNGGREVEEDLFEGISETLTMEMNA
jgi:LmbE family N-acetylglucosaminyl deacetylase